ncbi:MAG: TIGR02147 family protein [Fibrobacteres bacterium]|nr:TIGR02147 family protein [Fibrobacterota bacterium]
MKASLPDVTAYTDFRKFLRDCYDFKKKSDPKFSHRYFCKKAGYGSSSAFADILKGRRNLSAPAALRLARAFELGKSDEDYLLHLVQFNQADSLEVKNLHYARMLGLARISIDVISPDKYAYFSKWHHAALRELIYFTPCNGDYKALGRKLDPSVPAAQVKQSIALLEKLGMIRKDADGYYRQTTALLTADSMGESLHVENFQAETMRLAMESLSRHSPESRDMSTLTATLSAESLEKAKSAIKALRQCILALAEKDQSVDRVMQLNIQLFPLTRGDAGEKEG